MYLYDCEMKYLLRKGLLSVACSFESSCQVSLGDSPLTCVVNIDLNSKCDGHRDMKWSNSTIILRIGLAQIQIPNHLSLLIKGF